MIGASLDLSNDAATPNAALGVSLATNPRAVLSFDVEEHHRIEAATGLTISPERQVYYRERMEITTLRLLELLAERNIQATFFIVGQLAHLSPHLVKAIAGAGHEIGSHGWDHRRVVTMTPDEFREDARRSRDALEQVSGNAVLGYRAPTFSITRATTWAVEILIEEGYRYDSSIYPVRHDRYGVPDAPLTPFFLPTRSGVLLELPPLTLRLLGCNLPAGGGGYFRLFPNWLMRMGIRQMSRRPQATPAMLYFHPWEFDEEQVRLPLGWVSSWRTYGGIRGSMERLRRLTERGYGFVKAAEVVADLATQTMPVYRGISEPMEGKVGT
jgi:polysaccharide deacetylase family protein (PEP-CTERM system associated)